MKSWKPILALAAAVAISACGDTGNAAGGGIFRVNDIVLPDGAFNTTCILDDIRVVQAQSASVELANVAIGDVAPPDVVLDEYEVAYEPLDGGPELSPHDYPLVESVLIPANGTASFAAEFLPVKTKREFLAATTNTTNVGTTFFYRARYEFRGLTSFGDEVKTDGSASFSIGNFYIVDCD